MNEKEFVIIKVYFGQEIRRFQIRRNACFDELVGSLETVIGVKGRNIGIQYVDEEGDLITVTSDSELTEAFSIHSHSSSPLKIHVTDNNNNTNNNNINLNNNNNNDDKRGSCDGNTGGDVDIGKVLGDNIASIISSASSNSQVASEKIFEFISSLPRCQSDPDQSQGDDWGELRRGIEEIQNEISQDPDIRDILPRILGSVSSFIGIPQNNNNNDPNSVSSQTTIPTSTSSTNTSSPGTSEACTSTTTTTTTTASTSTSIPVLSTVSTSTPVVSTVSTSTSTSVPQGQEAKPTKSIPPQIQLLRDMGFHDDEKSARLLEMYNGDMIRVVHDLVN